MIGRRYESFSRSLVCPPVRTTASAVKARIDIPVSNVEEPSNEIQLDTPKGRVEPASEPADSIAGCNRACRGGQVADRVELRHPSPIRVGIVTSRCLLRHELLREAARVCHVAAQRAWIRC